MNKSFNLMVLTLTTAAAVTTGCGQKETAPPAPAEAAKSAPVAATRPEALPNPGRPSTTAPPPPAAASVVPAAPPVDAAPAPSATAAATGAPAAPAALADTTAPTAPVASGSPANAAAVAPPVPANPVSTGGDPTPSTMQKLLQASKGAFAQAATNEFRALTQNATNQSQAALASTTPVAVAGTNQVQALLEKAKSLTQNQKYQEALTNLTQLYNSKLTPEQKQKADDLKAQVQAGLAKKATEEATSVLGNILGGKKE